MIQNHTIMQYFEWHTNGDGNHWNRLKEDAPHLKERGIDAVWIPPVTKADSVTNPGYSVYDVYDLGEFDQKGEVRTKYGTKEELQAAIQACHDHDIKVYVDIVMNHKAGADETEVFKVVEVDAENRTKVISEPFNIEGFTKFTFPGRDNKYSNFNWNYTHFNGVDYDHKTGKTGIYKILGENKDWNEFVDDEKGNFDYLMFSNIDYRHPDVRNEMIEWGKWLIDELNIDGMRLDAIKHIESYFIRDFVKAMCDHVDGPFYFVGEFWLPDLETNENFLLDADYSLDLFDVKLHYNFKEASEKGQGYDLRKLFDKTLVQENPLNAVTFVDNHDSQPGEALESFVKDWFKPIAYAAILLRYDGFPVVFYGDYFGIGGEIPIDGKKDMIDTLLFIRKNKAYGLQDDYFDHEHVIGWVRRGAKEVENSGCAVIINSSTEEAKKQMFVGKERRGQVWLDYNNVREEEVIIDDEGNGIFKVNPGSVSVYCQKDI
ncbi:alpha-amylase [Macrococcus carouselicus]|uniref:Alpha-amylase n=1 Tax=Macrococcus carouselicus TaxID=69969 RepID=A0A9Q8FM95_9STAP|nr:alpha-amylase [Macrococcus carouselicus]TDM02521.1 alpha-amylase [Macrococcus carouselicus]